MSILDDMLETYSSNPERQEAIVAGAIQAMAEYMDITVEELRDELEDDPELRERLLHYLPEAEQAYDAAYMVGLGAIVLDVIEFFRSE